MAKVVKKNNGLKKVATKSVTKKTTVKKEQPKPESNEFMVTVPKVTFKKAVDLVSDALPSKEYNDAKSGIFMETKYVNDTPMLFLTANSLQTFITHGIMLQDDISEGFVVPNGNSLKKIVSGLQSFSSPIDMSFDEDENTFEIICGDDYESMIQHYDSVGFVFPPTEDEIKENDELVIPVKFIVEALNKVAFACSNDNTIPELTGIMIEQSKNSISIVGGDGNRIAYLNANVKINNPKRVIIGVKHLRMLNNIFKVLEVKDSDIVHLYLSEDKVFFISGNTIIGIQIFAGEYPIDDGYEQFVMEADDCEFYMNVTVDKFLERMDIATIHNNSVLEPIVMSIAKNKRTKKNEFKFCNTDISSNKFNVEFVVDKFVNNGDMDEIQLPFTPSYLYDVLRSLDVKQVMIGFASVDGPAIVKPIGLKDEDYCYTFSLN